MKETLYFPELGLSARRMPGVDEDKVILHVQDAGNPSRLIKLDKSVNIECNPDGQDTGAFSPSEEIIYAKENVIEILAELENLGIANTGYTPRVIRDGPLLTEAYIDRTVSNLYYETRLTTGKPLPTVLNDGPWGIDEHDQVVEGWQALIKHFIAKMDGYEETMADIYRAEQFMLTPKEGLVLFDLEFYGLGQWLDRREFYFDYFELARKACALYADTVSVVGKTSLGTAALWEIHDVVMDNRNKIEANPADEPRSISPLQTLSGGHDMALSMFDQT